MKFRLKRVHFMPKILEEGMLYVSEEFMTAAHLCPCGCGSKIRTPLEPTGWSLVETYHGPTLFPSIGNWQLPCKSHYWIRDGQIIWAKMLTSEQIKAGRFAEKKRCKNYYNVLYSYHNGFLKRLLNLIKTYLIKRR